jgi:hypothetical protein
MVGPDQQLVYYRDLTLEQWAYGYLSILERQVNTETKQNMIVHLKDLFMDTMLYGFRRAKGAHAKVLTDLEDGKYSWGDIQRIAETRRLQAQVPITIDERREDSLYGNNKKPNFHEQTVFNNHNRSFENKDSSNSRRKNNSSKTFNNSKKVQFKICRFYNEHRCGQEGEHKHGSTVWRHACLDCRQDGHRASECGGKQGKN